MKRHQLLLISISRRGYGWYLAIKSVKALCAIPLFVGYVGLVAVCAPLVAAWEIGKSLYAIALGSVVELVEFWEGRWFTRFSRQHYTTMLDYWNVRYPVAVPAELDRKGEEG